jgi:hypothetical protein
MVDVTEDKFDTANVRQQLFANDISYQLPLRSNVSKTNSPWLFA